jgi:hypothetical protein
MPFLEHISSFSGPLLIPGMPHTSFSLIQHPENIAFKSSHDVIDSQMLLS